MLKYTIENNEVTITGCKDQFVKSIVIPDTIDGYQVTRIARRAFAGRNNLKHLTIPNSITDMGFNLGCKNLKFINNVRLKDGITINNRFIYYGDSIYRFIYVIDQDYHHYQRYVSWGSAYMINGIKYSKCFR